MTKWLSFSHLTCCIINYIMLKLVVCIKMQFILLAKGMKKKYLFSFCSPAWFVLETTEKCAEFAWIWKHCIVLFGQVSRGSVNILTIWLSLYCICPCPQLWFSQAYNSKQSSLRNNREWEWGKKWWAMCIEVSLHQLQTSTAIFQQIKDTEQLLCWVSGEGGPASCSVVLGMYNICTNNVSMELFILK